MNMQINLYYLSPLKFIVNQISEAVPLDGSAWLVPCVSNIAKWKIIMGC